LKDLLWEIAVLSDLSPNDVPESCRFLLEINFTDLTSTRLKTQQYWTLAVNVALTVQQLENEIKARIN
jgi:hypothetical protein